MTTTQVLTLLQHFADEHPVLGGRLNHGQVPDMNNGLERQYPLMFVEFGAVVHQMPSPLQSPASQHSLTITVVDKQMPERDDNVRLLDQAQLICEQLLRWIHQIDAAELENAPLMLVVDQPTMTPLEDFTTDELVGWQMEVTIQADPQWDSCDDNVGYTITFPPGSGGGSGLDCEAIAACPVIEQMQEDIATLQSEGVAGASAYEVAVANGFSGDESAWLASLVGEDGTGIAGITQPTSSTILVQLSDSSTQGPFTLPAGPIGPTGAAGSTKFLTLVGTSTAVSIGATTAETLFYEVAIPGGTLPPGTILFMNSQFSASSANAKTGRFRIGATSGSTGNTLFRSVILGNGNTGNWSQVSAAVRGTTAIISTNTATIVPGSGASLQTTGLDFTQTVYISLFGLKTLTTDTFTMEYLSIVAFLP